MTQKFGYYDLIGTLVPGILLVCWTSICFPALATVFAGSAFPEAFIVTACLAAAVFVGQLVQSLGSLVEQWLFWSWGGRPSDRALQDGLGRYFPPESAARIRGKLSSKIGCEASTYSLFLYAKRLSNSATGLPATFNALYAYHRSLFILLLASCLLTLASWHWGLLSSWYWWHVISILVGILSALLLAWNRARQRAIYYAREVLLTAEKIIDEGESDSRQY